MGRRRKLVPVTLTTINISLETLDVISHYKTRTETQDNFVRRVLVEWQSGKEMIKDLELADRYKERRIEQYKSELKVLRNMVQNNPAIQQLC